LIIPVKITDRSFRYAASCHRLRGSASPVLMATALSMGKDNFRPPQNRHPSADHPQKTVTGDYVAEPYGCAKLSAYPSTRGLVGTWVKNNPNYFYLYPFLRNSPTGQTRWRIFMHDGSNDAESRKDVPFRDFSHCSPFRGQKTPKTPNFEAWIGVFKPVPTVKNLKFRKFKMVAAAILEIRKLTYLRRGLSDFDKIWHSDAVRLSWPFRSL